MASGSSDIKSLAVFCGSRSGNSPAYAASAVALANSMADNNIALVYGGASVGLMGVVADAMLNRSARVTGVITQALLDVEIAHQRLTSLEVVSTMHQRKARMADLADGFIMMPGGSGSLDEFFEVFTWLQLGYHNKPCAILNVAGYFDQLLSFINSAASGGFINPEHVSAIVVAENADALIHKITNYSSQITAKWVEA